MCCVRPDGPPLPHRPAGASASPARRGDPRLSFGGAGPSLRDTTVSYCAGSDPGTRLGEVLPACVHVSWLPLKGRLGQALLWQRGCKAPACRWYRRLHKGFPFPPPPQRSLWRLRPLSALAASCLQLKTWGDPSSLPHLPQHDSTWPGLVSAPQWINSSCVLCPQCELLGFVVIVVAFLPAVDSRGNKKAECPALK